jgi:hypothetical protein
VRLALQEGPTEGARLQGRRGARDGGGGEVWGGWVDQGG